MAKENREMKNSVFVDLFYEDDKAKENELALYNALFDENLPNDTVIEKFRVDDVLYMNFKNDVSFQVNNKVLVLAEHQSTKNPNMALRYLLYIGRAFEQLVEVEKRYSKKQVKLPRPEFYVFYNGAEPMDKEMELRLSDSFLAGDGEPMLNLSVKVININPAENHDILKKCQIMNEYSLFVDCVRKKQKEGNSTGFSQAIKECIDAGILADYLSRKGSEVLNMLTAEYDYEMDIKVQRSEALEDGILIGIERGEQKKLTELIVRKLAKGQSIEQIAEALEESPENIEKLISFSRGATEK